MLTFTAIPICSDSLSNLYILNANEIITNPELLAFIKFAAACSVSAILFYAVDLSANKLTNHESFLGIVYTKSTWWVSLLIWTLGAFSVGFLCAFSDFIKINRIGIITIGCSWPLIFSKLVKKSKNSLEPESTNDKTGVEV